MYQYFETLKVINQQCPLLKYHELRFLHTHLSIWGKAPSQCLKEILENHFRHHPDTYQKGIPYKCHISYDQIHHAINMIPYQKKKINFLRLVDLSSINYPFKSEDRSCFLSITALIQEGTEAIIIKNGLLRESTFTNIALLGPQGWITPEEPLLEGTRRAFLLEKGILKKGQIKVEQIGDYSKIRLFNAMVCWQDAWEFEMDQLLNQIPIRIPTNFS